MSEYVLTFPHETDKRHAEAVIAAHYAEMTNRRRIERIVRLDRAEQLGRVVDLDGDTFVIQISDRAGSLWRVVRDERADNRCFYTMDEALIRAVELRHGGGSDSKGHFYAAKLLGVPVTE